MKTTQRCFTQLQDSLTEEELDKFAKKVAEEYASSEFGMSRTYFTELYSITSKCFYRLLYRAIVCNLVTDETVNNMWTKARVNSNFKSQEVAGKSSTTKTDLNYTRLLNERKWFIWLQQFPEEKKIEITTYFAEHTETSKQECAEKFQLTVYALERVLEDTIVKNLVDNEIFLKIRKRSIAKNKDKKTVNYFAKLTKKRNLLKKKKAAN